MIKTGRISAPKARENKRAMKQVAVLSMAVSVMVVFCFVGIGSALIVGSDHDLSVSGSGGTSGIKALSETEVCVFCHTPHGATSETPLWNHQLSSAAYTLPGGGFLLTTVQPPDKGSRLCLSCHDGTVAIGALVNMPGPSSSGTVSMQGVDGLGRMPNTAYGWIGTDISGTHPVSIAVNDQLIADKNAGCVDFLLQYPPEGDAVKLKPTANKYPDSSGDPGREITTKTGFVYNEGVQCATCHDPHDNSNQDFLVKGSEGNWAELCETCHYATCP